MASMSDLGRQATLFVLVVLLLLAAGTAFVSDGVR
jgi:hypothetical protein